MAEVVLVAFALLVVFGLGGIVGFFFSLRVTMDRLAPVLELARKYGGGLTKRSGGVLGTIAEAVLPKILGGLKL